MGILGSDGKAMSCSSRTWSLRLTWDFVSIYLRVDTLGRGDTTDGVDTSFAPAPSARPARAINDFGCLPKEVEAVVRAFLGWGSLHSTSMLTPEVVVTLTEEAIVVVAATSDVGGSSDVSWWAMSAKIPDRKADPYDDRKGWFLGVMRAADLLRNSC